MKPLKIIHIVSEVDPFSKSGGLADVARSLPKALKRLGHEITIVTPLYGQIIDKKKHQLELMEKDIKLYPNGDDGGNGNGETVIVNYWRGYLMNGLPVYFIENEKYFSGRKTLYGSTHENARFMLFNVAALRLISMRELNPDIIHCHDWHAGLVPYFIKNNFPYAAKLQNAKTVYTIHNLAYQMGMNWWDVPRAHKDFGTVKLPAFGDPKLSYVNFAKRAIMSANIVNAVSEHYAEEILTPKFGQDLHRILQNRREKLFGIINGIDYKDYNPATDPGLKKNYSTRTIKSGKIHNKKWLQTKFGLPVNAYVPIIAMTSRIVFQKGFELILNIAEEIMRLKLQFIVIGSGDKNYINEMQKLAKHNDKFVIIPSHAENQKYETLIYAGADMLLLPSHHEPCGLNQLIAMRYGCVPIVHRVGGLSDTVANYNPTDKSGNGFVFDNFGAYELYGAIVRALELFKDKKQWRKLIIQDMQESNSWQIPAKKYVDLYYAALATNNSK
ncbi:glycogen synthase [Candidatus Falkowbacteria bacterium CG10_big_fil_rev_8_21_14_0_10_43_11]|uniref:Glycogen synthase n=1 Tax=Candidatus Falkowbacteria bacterium CG10_big_fil_rev_8_21_14_0_10_43_11 TaxID=1974568 RepID=A0A2M6WLX1_9BACT|nr:MAG: glycogen synthase [Candidatus Falkowbacteria bacterium CG10_big_fil_rev_8_21_14_0_10_43_11]